MTGSENHPHSSSCGVFPLCSSQSTSNMAQRRRRKVNQQMSFVSLNRWRSSCYFWQTGQSVMQFVAFFTWRTCVTKLCHGTKATWQSVMLLNKFYWESLGPAINIDVTLTRSTNLSMIADHKHSFMDIIFPDVFSSSRITHHIAKQNSQEMG